MMICAVVKGPTANDVCRQIVQAVPLADLVEWRFDQFQFSDEEEIRRLRQEFSIPVIFTLRSRLQGGAYEGTEQEWIREVRRLASFQPDYLDIESRAPKSLFEEINSSVKTICSYHDFDKTPELEPLYQSLKQKPATLYKIAAAAKSSTDALKMLCWAKERDNLIAISMGPYGTISRILGPVVGSRISYASLDEAQQTAPGQLTAQSLAGLYRYRTLNASTKIYGLIGDPVEHSLSHETHNALMQAAQLNAVYVKMAVKPEELKEFLHFARQLPFSGMSVTMPLKEAILPYLDAIDPEAEKIGAVNTLVFDGGKITGYNTDSTGALNAIERKMPVAGKRVVILGAGGAAKAIADETVRRGGKVVIVNRDRRKAKELAERVNGQSQEMKTCAGSGYDILINSTPVMPIDPRYIIPGKLVMDIKTRPKNTELLQVAKAKGCSLVYGYTMFVEQAVGQYQLWFQGTVPAQQCREVIEQMIETKLT